MARATSGKGGKGDDYRPTKRQAFEDNHIRLFGVKCPRCKNGCPDCHGKLIKDPTLYLILGGV